MGVSGVKYIEFADPEVLRVLIANGVSPSGVGITLANAEALLAIGDGWFYNNKVVRTFDELAFFVNAKEIGYRSFMGCTSLTAIDLQHVQTFKNEAFSGCTALSAINTDGRTWTALGNSVFFNCKAMEVDLRLDSYVGAMSTTFNRSGIRSLVAPKITSWNVYQHFGYCTNLKYVAYGKNTASIGSSGIFTGCTALEAVVVLATTPPTLSSTTALATTANIYVYDQCVNAFKESELWANYATQIRPISELPVYIKSEIDEYL